MPNSIIFPQHWPPLPCSQIQANSRLSGLPCFHSVASPAVYLSAAFPFFSFWVSDSGLF